jgi:hypothetical protein
MPRFLIPQIPQEFSERYTDDMSAGYPHSTTKMTAYLLHGEEKHQ